MFYTTDLRHFDGVELDPEAPAPAVRLARYLRRLTRAATADGRTVPHPTVLPCRRRPGRSPCPGLLVVSLQEVPPRIHWECPECGEAGVIDGWKFSDDDLSAISDTDTAGSEVRAVISMSGYQLMLDDLLVGRDCERMIYRARLHCDGVELFGTEDDFEELTDAVAMEANHATNSSKRRRWDEIYDQLDPPSDGSIESLVDVVTDELRQFHLVIGRAPIADLIRERIATVVSQLGISERSARRYMTEDALREIARRAAIELVDEQPGADLLGEPRTITVDIPIVGRTLAALAEAGHLRIDGQDTVGAHGVLELVSLFGQIESERSNISDDAVLLPRAALTRSARLLDATSEMIGQGVVTAPGLSSSALTQLASTFAEDAATLRALVEEQGAS